MRVVVPLPFPIANLHHGRNLRVAGLLRGLSGRCDVVCVTSDEAAAETAQRLLPGVEVYAAPAADAGGAQPVEVGLSGLAARAVRFFGLHEGLLAETVRQAADAEVVLGFDVVSAGYVIAAGNGAAGGATTTAHAKQTRRPMTVLDLIDDPWLTWRSQGGRARWSATGLKTACAVAAIRRWVLPRVDRLTAVARRDAAMLRRASGRRVEVVPNGVAAGTVDFSRPREPLAVFTGAMDFPPNEAAGLHLVRRIWPRVLGLLAERGHGDLRPALALVGANPSARLRRAADEAGVMVTGWVESLAEWLGRARLAVAPMVSGSGMKNKVLEAMAAGCPVVATPLGAGGLSAGPEKGLLVAHHPEGVARAIADLLIYPEMASSIGRAGHRLVRGQYSWAKAAEALYDVLRPAGTTERRDTDGSARAARPAADEDMTCVAPEVAHAAS